MKPTGRKRVEIYLPALHPKQIEIDDSSAKFKIAAAGRRGGKTTYGAYKAAKRLLNGKRVLLASPSQNQVDAFWDKLREWFYNATQIGAIVKNEQRRIMTLPFNQRGRIECRTARYANDLRGGFADNIILDEFAYLKDAEVALHEVIEPMLLDTDGDLDIYSSPKAGSYFNKIYTQACEGTLDEWEGFHFISNDNPHLKTEALDRLAKNSKLRGGIRAYNQEILAQILDEVEGAIWKRAWITYDPVPIGVRLIRIVVAIDPAASTNANSDETGIVVAAKGSNGRYYVLADYSGKYSPNAWAKKAIDAYHHWKADRIIAEKNNGGDMVLFTLKTVDRTVPIRLVHASRGKDARAEPIASLYEETLVSHANVLPHLEEQMVTWTPDADFSPDRMDALVWGLTDLALKASGGGSVF
jgi:hypothetical protein